MRFIASCCLRKRFVALLVVGLPLAAAGNTDGKLPLSFEPNQGQTDARVKFLARASGYTLFVTANEAVFTGGDGSVERMKLLEANHKLRFEPLDKQPGISNYFIGDNPSKWRTNIPNYGRVALREVYPGIDLVFYSNERQLEYDWIIAPGADPKQIRVKWEGPRHLTKNVSGGLVLSASLVQHKPIILQDGKSIEGGYIVSGREVAFELAKYDAAKPLVIDPVLVYSTYLGGSGSDGGSAIAVDGSGNAYVTGDTNSTNFPTANPLQARNGGASFNAFVTKINAAGSVRVYSTYLGGKGTDYGYGIAVDGSGNAYVTGQTTSTNFPTSNALQPSFGGGFSDAFVTKINAAGSALVYSTYLGGGATDVGIGIAVDGSGNAYVTGQTTSTNFPTANPLQASNGGGMDTYAAKINADGSALVYSTYLGGSGDDQGQGIVVDGSGNAYVTGSTTSTNFPTTNPLQPSFGGDLRDAFVTKINPTGTAFVYSTYLGGRGDDQGLGIAVDGARNAYVTGRTSSTNFPTANPVQISNAGGTYDAFVTKIDASGSTLVYSTYLGGSGSDGGSAIAVDGAGNAYVTGDTDSTNFPTANPLQVSNGGGFSEAFVFSTSTPVQASSATQFVPVAPCRIADTRNPNAPFGGPAIAGRTFRDFVIPNSTCGIPSTAAAYSMNVAVVPRGTLGLLTLWPSGQPQPLAATLNSIDGRVKSNATIVPAGANGAISVFAIDTTDVILDINGYFVAGNNPKAFAFYPLMPCRFTDTRTPNPVGGPSLAAQSTRSFPILAGSCGIPEPAQAYSLNFAAVPKGPTLGFMTAWPHGQPQPLVASLNDPTGTVLANAVIVTAGANTGAVNVFTTDDTDLVIDVNGYFDSQGPGGLSFYAVTPCRVFDSRLPLGSPPFSTTRDVNVTASPCGIPATAQAFVLNATVVPPGPLGFITMWPQGQTQPLAATLNAYDGAITNNMAIVPTTTGSISVYPSDPTHLVLDIVGYFAP